MISWQVAVLISGVLSGVAQGIGKRQVGKMSAFQSGVLRDGTIFLIMLLLFWYQGGAAWSHYNWIWILVGLLESVMMAAYYSASRDELASTVIFSYPLSSILIVAAAGAFFGEWQYFDPRTGLGIANLASLILIVALLFSYQGGSLAKTRWSTKIVLSSLMVVASNVVIKWAMMNLGLKPAEYMVYEYLGLVMGGVGYVTWRGQGMRVGWRSALWGLLQGVLFAISVLLIAEALRDHPLSLVSMIRRITIIGMTVTLGLWWYGEGKRMERKQLACLGGAGLILLLTMWVNR